MRLLSFFLNSKLRIGLTLISFVSFIETWSRYGFGATNNTGWVGVLLYSLTYAYGGLIWGIAIAGARMGVQKIRRQEAILSDKIINGVWIFATLSMIYKMFKYH
jgi:hypothetical protein